MRKFFRWLSNTSQKVTKVKKRIWGRGGEKQIIVKDFIEDTTLDAVQYRKGSM